jgi:transcription elongation factor Elf1
MPIDYENIVQYKTPFRCPDCGEHTFQTDKTPNSPEALVEAECTNCGHALTMEEIETQAGTLSPGVIAAMVAKYQGGESF